MGDDGNFTAVQLLAIDGIVRDAVRRAINSTCSMVTNSTRAYTDASAATTNASMDNMWMVIGGALVFFMHSGFALLEVGSVSTRNVRNILFKNVISPTFAGCAFWTVGYALAFGGGNPRGVIGFRNGWFLATANVLEPSGHGMPYNSQAYAHWFFQWGFCATASTIVSGAVAERISFNLYMYVTCFLCAIVYPIVVNWEWGGGWAQEWGVMDFAGCGAVHILGGTTALITAKVIGPRHGRFVEYVFYSKNSRNMEQGFGSWYVDATTLPSHLARPLARAGWCRVSSGEVTEKSQASDERGVERFVEESYTQETDAQTLRDLGNQHVRERLRSRYGSIVLPTHSVALQTLGTFILWFGWYGFNCGSTMRISGDFGGKTGKIAVITTLGASSGALSAGLVRYMVDSVKDLNTMTNGILAGLVSITGSCAFIEPWAAVVIGSVGGVVYHYSVQLIEYWRVDDPVLAIPVHLFCGLWGLLAVGIFSSERNCLAGVEVLPSVDGGSAACCGVLYCFDERGFGFLGKQVVFAAVVVVWVSVSTFGLLIFLRDVCHTKMSYNVNEQYEGIDRIVHTVVTPFQRLHRLESMDQQTAGTSRFHKAHAAEQEAVAHQARVAREGARAERMWREQPQSRDQKIMPLSKVMRHMKLWDSEQGSTSPEPYSGPFSPKQEHEHLIPQPNVNLIPRNVLQPNIDPGSLIQAQQAQQVQAAHVAGGHSPPGGGPRMHDSYAAKRLSSVDKQTWRHSPPGGPMSPGTMEAFFRNQAKAQLREDALLRQHAMLAQQQPHQQHFRLDESDQYASTPKVEAEEENEEEDAEEGEEEDEEEWQEEDVHYDYEEEVVAEKNLEHQEEVGEEVGEENSQAEEEGPAQLEEEEAEQEANEEELAQLPHTAPAVASPPPADTPLVHTSQGNGTTLGALGGGEKPPGASPKLASLQSSWQ